MESQAEDNGDTDDEEQDAAKPISPQKKRTPLND